MTLPLAHHVPNILNFQEDHVFLVQVDVKDAATEYVPNAIEDITSQLLEPPVYLIVNFPAKTVLTTNLQLVQVATEDLPIMVSLAPLV